MNINPKGLIPIVIVVVIAIISATLVGAAWWYDKNGGTVGNAGDIAISNFEQCATAGYPIMESYPRKCVVKGITFSEILGMNTNIESNTNSDTSTVDTSDWQTYTNSKYGFTFQYPADWKHISYGETNTLTLSGKEFSAFNGVRKPIFFFFREGTISELKKNQQMSI